MTLVADKMFLVLDSIATDENDVVSLARLTDRTQVPKATLYRLLRDLASAGVVDHGPGGYSLGTRLFELGNGVPKYRRLRAAAAPHLEELHRQTGDTVHLAMPQGRHVVVLEKLHATHRVRIPTHVGMKLPLHSTALGKTTLAHSPRTLLESVLSSRLRPLTPRTVCAPGLLVRQIDQSLAEHLSVECEETILGVGCLATPVLDANGGLIAALSVAGDPGSRRSTVLATRVRDAAVSIGAALAATHT